MGTTNSTDKSLNYQLVERLNDNNSGVDDWVYTNTGNEKRKNGLPVLNDTYTLFAGGNGESAEINAKLLNYYDAQKATGEEILAGPGIFDKSGIQAKDEDGNDIEYIVYGHPDKWVYDYRQSYNNCGVDSSLNILSMAGVKEIIEKGATYDTYLNTPIVKIKNKTEYDPETGDWKTIKVEETSYPKPAKETEHEFLLWAVQNSPNDSKWYKDRYEDGIPVDGNIPIIGDVEIDDYVLHSKNYEDYDSIEDMLDAPHELGGTTGKHRENILNYWGVEAKTDDLLINGLKEKIPSTEEPVITYETNDAGQDVRVTVSRSWDTYGQEETVTTLREVLKVNPEDPDDKSTWETISSEEVTVVTYHRNEDFYNFLTTLTTLVKEGKGVILSGWAKAFINEKGGPHAISLVGTVEGEVIETKTTTKKTFEDGSSWSNEENPEITKAMDTLGVYVLDSGGWIADGLQTERAQFIDCFALYNFLTNTEYNFNSTYKNYEYTLNEIRSWADEMSLVGNNRKNLLEGNESANYMWGGKGNDVISGFGGNDYLFGDENNDTIYGGKGNDVITGGSGNDTYVFRGNDFDSSVATNDLTTAKGSHDYLVVGSGKDNIQFDSTFDGTIQDIHDMKYTNRDGNLVIEYTITSIDGKYNNNSITVKDYFRKGLYSSIDKIIQADESETLYQEFDFKKIAINDQFFVDYYVRENENNTLKGSKFKDSLVGGNKNDSITGGDGNDIINGGASNDTIKAGKHNDTIYGSYGNDKIYGDAGDDVFKYTVDTIAGSQFGGHDTIYSGSGNDKIELLDYEADELTFVKAKNDLVIRYDAKAGISETGGSITIANYFKKKGNTSTKSIILNNGTDVISLQADYADILSKTATITGNDGYDLIKGGSAPDALEGGLGNDTLYGGGGNDALNGGLGSDKLYGQAGENTYFFDNPSCGEDTIYTSGNGKSTLNFTGSGVNFDSKGATDAINEYSFTKVKNDLIINYATAEDFSDSDNALIKVSNFFKSKGDFEILNADGTTLDLKTQATIYMNGSDEKKNKITGSNYNDLIIGYEYNDTFKGGKGNDTIVGGKGNDNLTGGTGTNVIQYTKGDGTDTINFTKGENLNIEVSGFDIDTATDATTKIFDYEIVKKDLIISYIDEKGKKEKLFTLKNFGSKDTTGADTEINFYSNGTLQKELRLGYYLDKVINFTPKKYSYTGKWQSEIIDTRALNNEAPSKNRGAKVNAGAGNDIIYGSDWNDTLNGGAGDDVIYGGYGINKLDGGKGNDTYHLFDKTISNMPTQETTTIKDTGKVADGTDKAYINTSSLSDIQTIEGSYNDNQGSIWFNIKANGTYTTTFNVIDKDGNKATITGVEEIFVKDASTGTTHKYNYEALVNDIAGWLSTNGYKDVNAVMKSYDDTDINALLAKFTTSTDAFTNV